MFGLSVNYEPLTHSTLNTSAFRTGWEENQTCYSLDRSCNNSNHWHRYILTDVLLKLLGARHDYFRVRCLRTTDCEQHVSYWLITLLLSLHLYPRLIFLFRDRSMKRTEIWHILLFHSEYTCVMMQFYSKGMKSQLETGSSKTFAVVKKAFKWLFSSE